MTVNINLNRNDICNLLLARIRSAGFVVPDADVDVHPEFEDELQLLIGPGWRHVCEEEPVVQIPIALVTPCNLRFMFDWMSGSPNLRLTQQGYSTPRIYLLRDVRVFHRHNFNEANELVYNSGYDWLDILEAGQLLAQLRHSKNCSSDQLGLGSVTTNSSGLSFESSLDEHQLHTLFFRQNVRARIPTYWEHDHHVAICKERVGLPNGRLYHGVVRQCS